jgi:hypothetical protein
LCAKIKWKKYVGGEKREEMGGIEGEGKREGGGRRR